MKKWIQPVIVGVIRKNGKYLLTQREDVDFKDEETVADYYHAWQLPGGGLEFGEDAENCLLRELKEEVGVDVEIVTLIPKLYHDVRNNAWHGLLICYLCKMKNESDKIVINSEACDYKWMPYNEIKEYKTLSFTKEIIELAEKFR